ncbi:DODA-type extradiol aromatic ring-opening family dioxygenase [Planctomyces sp. SH-PL62]|uniref:DODA-type extradiol aromatic ring-opening family dioxygenase n=1 Tax=Planctomyces sp. SH-PL62 TaxID=1636152 RepID=UPI00078D105C|nr:class III extradiol ring-cleavage dioxygenase [Planctomyces sp. SH-PL62]AMV37269.1 LigB family dioxygenase [Planctomyces sp. SH-PL62]
MAADTSAPRMPVLFIPHGGGPCFFMDWTMGPRDTWDRLAAWLRSVPERVGVRPRAILIVSGHWETAGFRASGGRRPDLIYDYSGFPPHTYQLTYPAPGDPTLAARVVELISGAGLPAAVDPDRGFDHGVFVPLKVAFPDADVPVVALSLDRSLDPDLHARVGAAIAPLRDEGVLIVGSGMSFHNLRAFFAGGGEEDSARFDTWLTEAVEAPSADERRSRLDAWATAPGGRFSHPREEHLIPLMVAAGAAGDDLGRKAFSDLVMGHPCSAFAFGSASAAATP